MLLLVLRFITERSTYHSLPISGGTHGRCVTAGEWIADMGLLLAHDVQGS
jgi:hypothetical protein